MRPLDFMIWVPNKLEKCFLLYRSLWRFLCVFGIGLIAGSTLGYGVGFQENWHCVFYVLWFLYVSNLRPPPCLHTLSISCVMVCILILFRCGFTLFSFPDHIWICLWRVVWVIQWDYAWFEL